MKTNFKLFTLFLLVGLLGALVSGCAATITRNADGSLTVETTMTGESLQSEIQAAIADPLIENMTVQLKQGYIDVSGERKRLNSGQIDMLTFRLDLGVSDGHLTATISNALLDGKAVEADRVALWNERIANRLEQFGQRRSNSSLQSVNVTSEAITMTWHVETARSQGN
jgi:osmotically-inducible protein OsmY